MDILTEIMLARDKIVHHCSLGLEALEAFRALCVERGIEEQFLFTMIPEGEREAYLAMQKEIIARYHTTNKFKVGDKVYVVPRDYGLEIFQNCIRATVTEVSTDGWGYHLRAFEQDLPGIFMFNQWDKDLIPRTSKKNMKTEDGRTILREETCHSNR